MWKMSRLGRLHALWLLLAHVRNPSTLRKMWKAKGEGFPMFGGEAVCSFANVKAEMAKEPEKLAGIFAPMDGVETFFSQGYMPFMQKGPNHSSRRAFVIERVEQARQRLDLMEQLLKSSPSEEHAIADFLLQTLGGIQPNAQEVDDLVFFRKNGPILAFFPAWMRNTVFKKNYLRAISARKNLLDRMTAAGNVYPDTCMEAMWFNAGTLGFYPEKAVEACKADAALLAQIKPEIGAQPEARPKMKALIMEMLRIHSRIASVNYLDEGKVKIALIATAVADPQKFPNPEKVDLNHDHSDSISFAMPSPNRSCPGRELAPEVMAAVTAHLLRKQGIS